MNKIIKNYESFNEGIMNDIKNLNPFRNKKLITKITNVLENDNLEEMYDLLEEILPLTYHKNTDKIINQLKKDKEEGLYRVKDEPQDILGRIKHYLKTNDISDIRVYGPNHGMNSYAVSQYDMSFSG